MVESNMAGPSSYTSFFTLNAFSRIMTKVTPATAKRCWKLAWGSRRFMPRTPGLDLSRLPHPERVQDLMLKNIPSRIQYQV
jgi:hypothetical protein